MDAQTRQNIITWLKKEIRAPYRRLVSQEYSFLAGLPGDDDGDSLHHLIEDLDDDELDALNHMGQQKLEQWVRSQTEAHVINGWFAEELVDVLCQHVGDSLGEQCDVTDDDICLAVEYLTHRSSVADLMQRFDDDPQKWLALIKLAKPEMADD